MLEKYTVLWVIRNTAGAGAADQAAPAPVRRQTTTRYAGEPEKVLLMRRKKEPPVIEW